MEDRKDHDNIVHLVDYIDTKEVPETFNEHEQNVFDLKHDKIMQRRIYSFLTDFSIIALLKVAIDTSYAIFINNFLFPLNMTQKSHMIEGNMGMHISIFLIIYTTYFLYSNYTLNGQTVGKMIFKLRVVQDDYVFEHDNLTFDPNLAQAWRRTVGYLTCYLTFGTFFVFSFMSDDKRGLPDYLSKTRTVSEEWFQGMQAYKKYEQDELRIDINSLDYSEAA